MHFRVNYMTRWGQIVVICGAGALLGSWNPKRGHRMRCHHEKDNLVWEALISLPLQSEMEVNYKYYIVRDDNGEVEGCETQPHCVVLHEELQHGDIAEVFDTWSDNSHPGAIYQSAAFTKVLRLQKTPVTKGLVARTAPGMGEAVVTFQVSDHMMQDGDVMLVTGGIQQLGSWQQGQMLALTETTTPCWEGEVRVAYAAFPFTYKYAIRGANGLILEVGEPRVATLPLAGSSQMGAPAVLVRHDGFFRRDKLWRGAGVAFPVFSLRTRESLGCGEFLDLMAVADWAEACGLRMIQLLPVNDSCVYGMWWDSYPYCNVSVFALHPMYLRLRALREELPKEILDQISAAAAVLNAPKDVDYEATLSTKLTTARAVFNLYGGETLESQEYKAWAADNADWLQPYAVFCLLRDLFGTSEHWQWGCMAKPTPEMLARLSRPGSDFYPTIQFTYYLQYHLHLQLHRASTYAASKAVVLKGDLPIGVDKRSVDTWLEPQLFRMDKSTGAPPDVFDPNGQNWGFPTYNWEEMAKDEYLWWRRRLHHLANYFHAYRIDHILGFFRIWEIPGDCVTGLLGYFRPSIPIWRHELEQAGIWDFERLTEPYIRMHLLDELFAESAHEVAAKYLVEAAPGCYRFRPQYSSEKLISEIKVRDDSPAWLKAETAAIRKGLIRLRQNVVMLRDPEDPNRFYPRFQLKDSSSFKELELSWRDTLQRLHDDYYFNRQEDLWRRNALKTLPVLMQATDMLVCGEDLGFVPRCVPPVMQELGLVGLRIQRMASGTDCEFNNPADYGYLTVASPSCHDVPPLRAWYEADPDRRERFFYQALKGCGAAPEVCTVEIAELVIQQHLNSPAVWIIIPMQDLFALSDRWNNRPATEEVINDPTNPKHYWRYRCHVDMEDLIEDADLTLKLRDMLAFADRLHFGASTLIDGPTTSAPPSTSPPPTTLPPTTTTAPAPPTTTATAAVAVGSAPRTTS